MHPVGLSVTVQMVHLKALMNEMKYGLRGCVQTKSAAAVGVSLAKHSRTRFVTSGCLYRFVGVCVRSLKDWQLQCDGGYKINRFQLLWHGQLHFLDPVSGGKKKTTHCSKNRPNSLIENDGKTCVFAGFGLNAA